MIARIYPSFFDSGRAGGCVTEPPGRPAEGAGAILDAPTKTPRWPALIGRVRPPDGGRVLAWIRLKLRWRQASKSDAAFSMPASDTST